MIQDLNLSHQSLFLALIKVRTKTGISIAKTASYHYGQFKGILAIYLVQNFPLKRGVMKSEIRFLNCSANNHLLSVIRFNSLVKNSWLGEYLNRKMLQDRNQDTVSHTQAYSWPKLSDQTSSQHLPPTHSFTEGSLLLIPCHSSWPSESWVIATIKTPTA